MKKYSLLVFGLCALMFSVQSARGFIGLALRVGMFYTTYKFVDGVSDSGLSTFVDTYSDGPFDAIYSFGSGVKRFGLGFRNALSAFSSENGSNAFSKSWSVLKQGWSTAVDVTKKEWKERREKSSAVKEKRQPKNKKIAAQGVPQLELMVVSQPEQQKTITVTTNAEQEGAHAV